MGHPGIPPKKGQWGISAVPAVLASLGRGVLLKNREGTFQLGVLLVKGTIQAQPGETSGVEAGKPAKSLAQVPPPGRLRC